MRKPAKILLILTLSTLIFTYSNNFSCANTNIDLLNHSLMVEQGLNHYGQTDYSKALEYFLKANQLKNNDATTLYYIAKTYEHLNIPERSINYYKEALKISETSYIWYNLGLLYFNLKKIDLAEDAFKEAIKTNDKNAFAYYNLANIDLLKNRLNTAIYNYEKAIKYNSKIPEFYYNLGYSFQLKKKYKDAYKNYTKYLQFYPEDTTTKDLANSLKDKY